MLSDDLVAESVNEKVETFYRNIKTRHPAPDGSLGQVAVLFSQKRSKKTWFSSTEVNDPISAGSGLGLTKTPSLSRNRSRSKYTSLPSTPRPHVLGHRLYLKRSPACLMRS